MQMPIKPDSSNCKGANQVKRLLRKPRLSTRAASVYSSTKADDFLFVDSQNECDFITQNEGSVISGDLTHHVPQSPHHEKKKHKSVKLKISSDKTEPSGTTALVALVKPRLTRGPRNFPSRPMHRSSNLLYEFLWDEEDLLYTEVPEFTLNDFMSHVAELSGVPIHKVKDIVYSRHNYKKLTRLLAEQNNKTCDTLSRMDFSEQLSSIPAINARVPNHHLLIEMAAIVKEQMNLSPESDVKACIKRMPKYQSPYHKSTRPLTEIIIYDSGETTSPDKTVPFNDVNLSRSVAESLLQSGTPTYFQGGPGRTQSSFVSPNDTDLNVAEVSLLECLANGGLGLSLKAQFISILPDLSSVVKTLTYLNLSFNDFKTFPPEVLTLRQLTTLKMRNNPINMLPEDIHVLVHLRTFVISFCLLSTIPVSLFTLRNLIHLDISYNRLSFLPNEIRQAGSLEELNVEGNQLQCMPCGALRLRHLRALRVKNNFMHPLFWREATKNQPQRLVDIAAMRIHESEIVNTYELNLEHKYKVLLENYVKCDCCSGRRYGPGIRVIRPCTQIFGVKNLPFLFNACSPSCASTFMKDTSGRAAALLYD